MVGTLRLDLAWWLAALLVSVRVAAATLVAPVFGPLRIPGPVRVLLALTLGAVLVPLVTTPGVVLPTLAHLVAAVTTELVVGAALGFGFLAAYGATQVAGRILDVQIGFGVASILNPATEAVAPLLGTVFGMAAIAVFVGLDGHHALLQALSVSLSATPPGSLLTEVRWEALLAQSAVLFTYGVALAGPAMLMLLLIDLAMAVISRSLPQLNVFVLSFAVKIVVGLLVLAVSLPYAGNILRELFAITFRFWSEGPVL